MAKRRDRSAAFWLQLTLQTAALVTAANAAEWTDTAPHTDAFAKSFVTTDYADEAFLYPVGTDSPPVWIDPCDASCVANAEFQRPTLPTEPVFDLLGGLDALGEPDSSDWLFVY
jgi:hypothetical protein